MREYDEALEYLEANERISDKLMILSMYEKFFLNVIALVDNSKVEEYEQIMVKTFKLLAETINKQRDTDLNVSKFMKLYFELLKHSGYFDVDPAKEVILNFEKSLNDIRIPKYIELIEQSSLASLELKDELMKQYELEENIHAYSSGTPLILSPYMYLKKK